MPGTVFTPRQVRILKVVVIVMGVLLVGGFALVLGAIVYQASNVGKSAARVNAAMDPALETLLAIPPGAQIRHMATGDGRLVIHLEAGGAGEIVILDINSGQVLSRIRLRPE